MVDFAYAHRTFQQGMQTVGDVFDVGTSTFVRKEIKGERERKTMLAISMSNSNLLAIVCECLWFDDPKVNESCTYHMKYLPVFCIVIFCI